MVVSTGLAIGAATLNPVGSGAASGAAIGIQKSADVTGYSSAGTPIIYSYVVTNTGRVTLTSVSVTDGMPGLSEVSCPESTLAVAASETCTATYTTTQADVDAGKAQEHRCGDGDPTNRTQGDGLVLVDDSGPPERGRSGSRSRRISPTSQLRVPWSATATQ